MTISNTTNRTSATGTADTGQIISFSFPIVATSDLMVITRVIATGVEATLALTTDYAVTLDGNNGGWVTLVAAATTAKEIHIIRATPQTQSLDLAAGGTFSAENIEAALDKAVKLAIENKDGLGRCLKITNTDGSAIVLTLPNAIDRAERFLYFDSSGNVSAVALSLVDVLPSGAFGELVLATVSEAAFKTLANLEAGTDFNAYSSHLAALVAAAKTDSYFVVGNGTTWVSESPSTALTSLGVSAFIKTLLDDATAAAARTTLGAVGIADILCWEDNVLSCDGEVLTWNT